MESAQGEQPMRPLPAIPWFGVRKMARALLTELQEVRAQRDEARKELEALGLLSLAQLEARRVELEREVGEQCARHFANPKPRNGRKRTHRLLAFC